MSLNDTPSGERIHIGIFGRRNAGKSSLINALTNQKIAIVSDVKGTTTDPVYKSMELLPLGPVVIIDTPGIDDDGELGAQRVAKSYQVLNKTDIAILVIDGATRDEVDNRLLDRIRAKHVPHVVVYNKCDMIGDDNLNLGENEIAVSAKEGKHINELREMIASVRRTGEDNKRIVGDLLSPSDLVILVVPIDKAAPKGRLILPQQQTIRDILDTGACALVVRDSEYESTLSSLGRVPSLVITDSQAFGKISAETPSDIPLTSFSILMARHKGILYQSVYGAAALDKLNDGDRVLISEGCTHHRQCDDIGTVKIPRWIERYTGKKVEYSFSSGLEFPDDLGKYNLIVHCGGCMLNEREVKYRMRCAEEQGVPMTNYGILIAQMNGILARSIAPLPEVAGLLNGDEK